MPLPLHQDPQPGPHGGGPLETSGANTPLLNVLDDCSVAMLTIQVHEADVSQN